MPTATPLQRASRVLMGTQVDMVVHGASSSAPALQAAMERAFAHMQTLEAMMSRFRSDSVLQQINAQAGKAAVTVPPEMMAVLGQARSVWHASNGAFDPTVGALAAWRFEPGVQAMPSTAQISQALQHIGADKLQLSASNNTAPPHPIGHGPGFGRHCPNCPSWRPAWQHSKPRGLKTPSSMAAAMSSPWA